MAGIDTECLLTNLSETLACANATISDLAFELEGSRRHIALGVQQLIELSELLANRVLDERVPVPEGLESGVTEGERRTCGEGASSLATGEYVGFETVAQSSPSFFNRYRIDRNDNFNRCAAAVRFQRVSSSAWRMSLRSTSSR